MGEILVFRERNECLKMCRACSREVSPGMFDVSNFFQAAHRLAITGFYFIIYARFRLRLLRLYYCLLYFILSASRFESASVFFFFFFSISSHSSYPYNLITTTHPSCSAHHLPIHTTQLVFGSLPSPSHANEFPCAWPPLSLYTLHTYQTLLRRKGQ